MSMKKTDKVYLHGNYSEGKGYSQLESGMRAEKKILAVDLTLKGPKGCVWVRVLAV